MTGEKIIIALLLLLPAGTAQASPAVSTGETTQARQEQLQQTAKPRQLSSVSGASTVSRGKISEEEMVEARELLAGLGYWIDMDANVADASLRHALIAFQKIEGRRRTGILNREELAALRVARRPQAWESGDPHIEVDLSRQILFVVDEEGEVSRILSVSTGSGEFFTEGGKTRRAVTPSGRFAVTYKIGGQRSSPLGSLYYPNYIYKGVAIHGNPSVPARPASHGCIRIPMFAAREFYGVATVGMPVLVYYSSPSAPAAYGSDHVALSKSTQTKSRANR